MSAVPEVLRTTVSFAQHDIDSITIDNRSEVIFAYPQRTEDGHFFRSNENYHGDESTPNNQFIIATCLPRDHIMR